MDKIELLKKIKALAEQGIDGEKSNATELYNKLLKQYNILETDLNEDTRKEYEYFYKYLNEIYIYLNITEYVRGVKDNLIRINKKRKILYIYLTDTEKKLFDIVLNFYKPYFDKKIKELKDKQKEFRKNLKKMENNDQLALIHAIIYKNKLHRNFDLDKEGTENPNAKTINNIGNFINEVDNLGFSNAIDYNNLLEN